MATIIREPKDAVVWKIAEALNAYEQQFAGSQAELYRQNPGSVRIRIVDDRFVGMPRSRRHNMVWQFLSNQLDEDTMGEISLLLPLPRKELSSSLANLDFDDPSPSEL